MSRSGPIRVLVVEDSPVARQLILHILSGEPAIEVVGTAGDGVRALEAAVQLRPDVITMDIVMPRMDGLETTRRLMSCTPLPIIIVSGTVNRREVSTTFEALRAGAVAAIPRPAGPGSPDYEPAARELVRTVRAMADVKVLRRWAQPDTAAPPAPRNLAVSPQVVAIGASTGGPETIRRIVAELPGTFPLPLLVAQHMAPGFLGGFADWIGRSSSLPVALGCEGERVTGGRVYVAPDDRHMGITDGLRIVLSDAPPEKGVRPAVGFLFRSIHQVCGPRAVAILLTGMGNDGVRELKELHDAGAVTIAQDEASCIIYGMPGEAVRAGAAGQQLTPSQISRTLANMAAGKNPQ